MEMYEGGSDLLSGRNSLGELALWRDREEWEQAFSFHSQTSEKTWVTGCVMFP